MTEQEMFNKIVEGLGIQGKPSIDNAGRCMYRSPDGCKCAIGILIPDDEYSPKMENQPLEHLFLFGVLGELENNQRLKSLGKDLQLEHDCAARKHFNSRNFLQLWKKEFINSAKIIAKEFNLDDSIIDKTWG